ncbi:1,4-dihydroxy-2-naphthoate octaprenyltransferase [Clostridium aminobutyricum]|uniref:1,4-dihydroxy-2-naphthoate octaprenyltransferase n=1 Tax=Clostridium aminobutyricum TaxID=33953 RepID=A0A939IIH6_CLOAM|nr:1,4-dihydroxy-2-naphthoate octaprenyltransferase [Clostridium aminobutyricum]MBN7772499.1 1,4-dihydroxy-2-naphthoate octaprenyltransferase [Clostridium aminobutyricum]
MKQNKAGKWLQAIRPFSLSGSVVPVILGAILAIKEAPFHVDYFVLSVIAIVLLQAGVNLLSDYDDYVNKVDTKDSYGSSGVIFENLLAPSEVHKGGLTLMVLGSLIGLYLVYQRGWVVLLLGLIGALGGYCYTGKPLGLKYKGFGAPLVFLLFGPLMVLGSYYVQAQTMSFAAFLASIPVGFLTTAILHANDIRDIEHDKKAGIKTLSILAGRRKAIIVYYGLIILSYSFLLLGIVSKIIPYWSLLCFATIPAAIKMMSKLRASSQDVTGIIALDKETGRLQAQFGFLFVLSLLLSLIHF